MEEKFEVSEDTMNDMFEHMEGYARLKSKEKPRRRLKVSEDVLWFAEISAIACSLGRCVNLWPTGETTLLYANLKIIERFRTFEELAAEVWRLYSEHLYAVGWVMDMACQYLRRGLAPEEIKDKLREDVAKNERVRTNVDLEEMFDLAESYHKGI